MVHLSYDNGARLVELRLDEVYTIGEVVTIPWALWIRLWLGRVGARFNLESSP